MMIDDFTRDITETYQVIFYDAIFVVEISSRLIPGCQDWGQTAKQHSKIHHCTDKHGKYAVAFFGDILRLKLAVSKNE